MKKALTLIETIFSLFMASILFLLIFRLTDRSFNVAVQNVRNTQTLRLELNQLLDYERGLVGRYQAKELTLLLKVGRNEYVDKLGIKICTIE